MDYVSSILDGYSFWENFYNNRVWVFVFLFLLVAAGVAYFLSTFYYTLKKFDMELFIGLILSFAIPVLIFVFVVVPVAGSIPLGGQYLSYEKFYTIYGVPGKFSGNKNHPRAIEGEAVNNPFSEEKTYLLLKTLGQQNDDLGIACTNKVCSHYHSMIGFVKNHKTCLGLLEKDGQVVKLHYVCDKHNTTTG